MLVDKKVVISVIVPCRNEGRHISELIKRLLSQKGVGNLFSLELLIIDGQSEDNTLEAIMAATKYGGSARVLENPARITPTAFNIGIKASTGQYICIIGAHSRISHDYLENALKTIREMKADNVGGPWKAVGEGYWGEAISLAFQSPFSCGGAKSHSLSYRGFVDSVWGGFYKREVFFRIGYFDEELVRNQDDELNFRLVMAGGKIFQSPDIRYEYVCRATLRGLWQQYYQYGYYKAYIFKKHHKPAALRHLIPSVFVLILFVLATTALFSISAYKVLLVLCGIYSCALLVFSVNLCARPNRFRFLLALPVIFVVFHFAYGIGFLFGIYRVNMSCVHSRS